MTPAAVFDLDKVLLGGNATRLFLSGRLRQAPARALLVLVAAPVLLAAAAVPGLRPLAERALTRLAIGRRDDDAAVCAAFREALARRPEAALAQALARVREHLREGHRVVVATGSEETLARGFLAAVGLGAVEVAGSTGTVWPPRSRRTRGEAKVTTLTDRGYPPPWPAVYSDSASDLPLFAGTPRPVLVNAGDRAVRQVARRLGREPGSVTWR